MDEIENTSNESTSNDAAEVVEPGRSGPPDPCRMDPREALERLRRGETLENVRLDRLHLRGEFEQPITLRNCTVVRLMVEKATFRGPVTMAGCTLHKPRFQRNSTFAQGLNLAGSQIDRCEMRQTTFQGVCRLDGARVQGQFRVAQCTFEGELRFWETHFEGWVDLRECTFRARADWRSFHADEGFTLKKCVFQGEVLLRGATVSKKLDLGDSRFEGMLDLSKAKLHDFVYAEQIEQGPAQRFALQYAVAERILVRPDQVAGRLASEENRNWRQAMEEYSLLKQSYNKLHRFEEEDWAFYRFKVNQRRGVGRSWSRPWTKLGQFGDWLFLDLGCAYGTNPYRTLVSAFALILLFGIVFMFQVENIYAERLPFAGAKTDPGNRVLVGFMTSVSVFTTGLGGIREMARGWVNALLIVESLIGTVLWGLFIVAFSRKVIR